MSALRSDARSVSASVSAWPSVWGQASRACAVAVDTGVGVAMGVGLSVGVGFGFGLAALITLASPVAVAAETAVAPPRITSPPGACCRRAALVGAEAAATAVSKSGRCSFAAAAAPVPPSAMFTPLPTNARLEPFGYAARASAAAVAYRSAPAWRDTLGAYRRSVDRTASETAPVPPATTIRAGRSRRSSLAVTPVRLPRLVRRTGPPRAPAAAAAANIVG